jgi:hypothetical protein
MHMRKWYVWGRARGALQLLLLWLIIDASNDNTMSCRGACRHATHRKAQLLTWRSGMVSYKPHQHGIAQSEGTGVCCLTTDAHSWSWG